MMRALPPSAILMLQEQAAALHPVDRALLILSAALPAMRWEDLATLGIGERDALLIEVRERTFGGVMESDTRCPSCSERIEFSLSTRDLRRRPAATAPSANTIEIGGIRHVFRLPDSFDMAAAARCADPVEARRAIAGRCVSRDDGSAPEPGTLDDDAIRSLAERMAGADPALDITLDLVCPVCAGHWEMILDITSYLWTEIREEGRRLLRDVHTLARAYGWSEAEIIGLTPARRQSYLEMVG